MAEPGRSTVASLTTTVMALRGKRLTGVFYYGLPGDGAHDCDYGDWHHAVMGVEFYAGSERFSLVWANSFGEYGAELYEGPMSRHVFNIGEPGGATRWDMTDHDQWRMRLNDPVEDVAICWTRADPPSSQLTAWPAAIRLCFPTGNVWLIAAMPQWPAMREVLWPGDEIVVGFTENFARQLAIPAP